MNARSPTSACANSILTDSVCVRADTSARKPSSRRQPRVGEICIAPARALGPKASALHARRLRQAVKAPSRRKSPTSSSSRPLSSGDGTLSFVVRATSVGLYVERTQRRSLGSRLVQSMVFDDADWFVRWCEADPVRFDHPVLYQQLRRQGDAFFSAQA